MDLYAYWTYVQDKCANLTAAINVMPLSDFSRALSRILDTQYIFAETGELLGRSFWGPHLGMALTS
jgi:hypothetical protein